MLADTGDAVALDENLRGRESHLLGHTQQEYSFCHAELGGKE